MKKFPLILITFLLLFNVNCVSVLAEKSEDINELQEDFIINTQNYDELELTQESENEMNTAQKIFLKIYDYLFSVIKDSWLMFFSVILISIITSLAGIYVKKENIYTVIQFSCICMCGSVIVYNFREITDICFSSIRDLSDFMDIAIPTYASVLVGSGYGATAVSVQGIFMVISVFITHFIEKIICPLLFICGILSIVSGLSSSVDLSRFIKLISKTVKYILGITTTVFAGILAFSGFSASAGDNIGIRTAKYAVANFVPVVGACLSEALNGIVQSSLIMKNSIGYVGFLTLLSICLIPVIKIFVAVFSFRLSASACELFSQTKLGSMLDSVCEVLVTLGGMVIFITVIFVLIIGVISSAGL